MITSERDVGLVGKTDTSYIFTPSGFLKQCDISMDKTMYPKIDNIRNIYLSFNALRYVNLNELPTKTSLYQIHDSQFDKLQCKGFTYENKKLLYIDKPVYFVLPEKSFVQDLMI